MSEVSPPLSLAAKELTDSRATVAWLSSIFAGTVLVSAFLLFQVQPLISKYILPWFGGSPAVWTTCMLFFQVTLFAGYAYAHFSQRFLSPRSQGIVHVLLLLAAMLMLPIAPSSAWKPLDSAHPTERILALLTATVGLPYFALSATGPLLQAWFSRAYPGRSPYRLYALSNIGSLAALLSYPFLFEPALELPRQVWFWSGLFVAFSVLCGACAIWIAAKVAKSREAEAVAEADSGMTPTAWRRVMWIGLPACASLMLLATTNKVCQDVAVIPFLWVVPLSLYLLTFIICFDHERWYMRLLFCTLTAVALLFIGLMPLAGFTINYVEELFLYFATMFLVCMVCHGELVRSRPGSSHLTEFYLLVSAGGALGGIFVSLVAPAIFTTVVEWPIALFAALFLAVGVGLSDLIVTRHSPTTLERRITRVLVGATMVAAVVAAIGLLPIEKADPNETALAFRRNFYGVTSVWDIQTPKHPEHAHRTLMNGRISHGLQLLDPAHCREPIAYYVPASGIGQVFGYLQDRKELKIGVVGLGIGALAGYSRPGVDFRFYEINPQVIELANDYFTFLSGAPGKCEVVQGDARLSLDREESREFDLLILDAFSGDAIPTHLLTKEAFEIYNRQLKSEGVLAVHITNHYLDLAPVVVGLAKHLGFEWTRIYIPDDRDHVTNRSDWMLLTRDKKFIETHPPQFKQPEDANVRDIPLWTDQFSNLLQILHRKDQ